MLVLATELEGRIKLQRLLSYCVTNISFCTSKINFMGYPQRSCISSGDFSDLNNLSIISLFSSKLFIVK